MTAHIRLLLCHVCKTMDEIPDYEGNPDNDDTLSTIVHRHAMKHPDRMNSGQLLKVNQKDWDSPSTRAAIEKAISESAGHTGFDTSYYETKAVFQEEAMTCWKKHNRTTNCGDYKSKGKLLQPGTNAERKSEGLARYQSNTYLCQMCPMESLVISAARKKAGMYK